MSHQGFSSIGLPEPGGIGKANGDAASPHLQPPALKVPPQPDFFSLAMPLIQRLSVAPKPIDRRPLRRLWNGNPGSRAANAAAVPRAAVPPWRRAARRRRSVLFVLVLTQTLLAGWSLSEVFPYPSLSLLEMAILALFAILFSWISLGFWSSVMGFWVLWRRTRRFNVAELLKDGDAAAPLALRTAVVMPIYNEDVKRVFAGLEASFRSLRKTGNLGRFDFFVLSDSTEPDIWIAEELAWAEICRALQGFGKIFYRHRRNNIKRKSGNIADFLRRWGSRYDAMVVFDADSVMAGEALVALARMLEWHPRAGIIQPVPMMTNRDSLFARAQQFASRVYGPMLGAGIHFWQLGESYYWGHNAIIRIAPFVEHCGLSRLPGEAPLGGEILSHDFVEAALMGRAGWEVWIAYDLPGSYEEIPPTLLDELQRDRRWCQGNLQHLRLLFSDGIRAGHCAILSMGVMAYASSLFWAVFLILTTIELGAHVLVAPVYFPPTPTLFPIWPRWSPEQAIALLSMTALLLFLPKWLSVLLILKNRESRAYGGVVPLGLSMILEMVLSTLLAPVRMWFHSKFVLTTLLGRQIRWGPQRRADDRTRWIDALRFHSVSTVFGVMWIAAVWWIHPESSWWVLPVPLSLALSAPLSVYSSYASLGRAVRRCRLFLIPEEISPPDAIRELQAGLRRRQKAAAGGFARAVASPFANALHVQLLRSKSAKSAKAAARNQILRNKAVERGLGSLTGAEKTALLRDAHSMTALHRRSRAFETFPAGLNGTFGRARRPIPG
jgi:membrane glycosyltransferase